MDNDLRSKALRTASELPVGTPRRKQILAVLERMARSTVAVGTTVETEYLRIHRYMDSVRIWDLTNAGRRGKKVEILAVYDLDAIRGNDIALHKFEEWLNWAAGRQTFDKTVRGAKMLIEELSRSLSYMPKMQVTQARGVDVDPPASVSKRLKFTIVDTPALVLSLEVKPSDVRVRETTHRLNDRGERQFYLHDTVLANTNKVRETKVLYNWVIENEAKLKRAQNLVDVRKMLDAEGVPYRTFYLD